MTDKPKKKKKLWEVDPAMFEAGHKLGFFQRHVVAPLRQAGKFGLYGLAIAYPLLLVLVAIAYGGIAFWVSLAGSMIVIGFIIKGLGLSSNFADWDIGYRRMLGLLIGFVIAIGFYSGLFYFKTWLLPIFFGLLVVGLVLVVKRTRA